MKTIKKICSMLGILCVEVDKHGLKFLLVDGKVFFPETIFNSPEGRDMIQRAWLMDCGLDVDKYYKNIFHKLEKELR